MYRLGQFTLDPDRQQLLAEGCPLALTRKNYEILRELAAAWPRVVSREELTRAVWQETAVEEATLRQNIYTLRNLLREADPSQEYLETVPKSGYRLAVPVEMIDALAPEPAAPEPVAADRPRFGRRWIAAAVGTVVLLVAGAALARRSPPAVPEGRVPEYMRQAWLIMDQRDAERFSAALALFDDALELDPRHANAYSGRALVAALRGDEAAAVREAAMVEKLDPASGVPFAVRGYFQMMFHHRWKEAGLSLAEVRRKGCPDPFCRQWYAFYLGFTGALTEAVRDAAGAVEGTPNRLAPRALYGQLLYWAGKNDAAIRELTTVVDSGGSATHARLHLWKAQWIGGDRRAACQTLLRALEPAWFRLPAEDELRQLNEQTELHGKPEFLTRLLDIGKRTRVNSYFMAEIAMAAGDRRRALDELERSLNEQMFFVPYARRDPLFAPLHGDERYEAVMRRVGL